LVLRAVSRFPLLIVCALQAAPLCMLVCGNRSEASLRIANRCAYTQSTCMTSLHAAKGCLGCRPFTKAHRSRATDRELVRLKYYLALLADKESLEELDHRKWERYMHRHLSVEQMAALRHDLEHP
jgi:hypothetical protein